MKTRRLFVLAAALFTLAFVVGTAAPVSSQEARDKAAVDLLKQALSAMGGEARWGALGSIRVEGVGHQHALMQSERPEGPWITTYRQFSELRDLEHGRVRLNEKRRGLWWPEWLPIHLVADRDAAMFGSGDRSGPARSIQHAEAIEGLDLSPERILLTALDAPDLAGAGDTLIQGVSHHIVTFGWDDRTLRLFLNAETALPAGYSLVSPLEDIFANIWGDLPTVVLWSNWSLEPGGWLYPRQTDEFRLAYPFSSEYLTAVTFDVPAPADSFAIPDETRQAFVAASSSGGFASRRPGVSFRGEPQEQIELAPGVVTLPGMYAATWVRQTDGVVILDGQMSSEWTTAVLEAAERNFPGEPVKAVVSTSDAWPHIGGLREYVARGVPVVALDLNVPLLERILGAPHERAPDRLALSPRPPEIRSVSGPTTIGEGPNRIELYPVRGEGSERMMVAWLPEHRVLYASDLVQIQPDGTAWSPEYLLEVWQVVDRYDLEPETVFAMHTPPMPWQDVMGMIEESGWTFRRALGR